MKLKELLPYLTALVDTFNIYENEDAAPELYIDVNTDKKELDTILRWYGDREVSPSNISLKRGMYEDRCEIVFYD